MANCQTCPLSVLKSLYLQRYAWPISYLSSNPDPRTELIVVIPCYNEPDILEALVSIEQCVLQDCNAEIIIVINHGIEEPPDVKEANRQTVKSIETWLVSGSKKFNYHVIKAFDLPQKMAGVGLARKIGMDEAVRRFEFLNKKKGIIVCYDADCICKPNYLREICNTYKQQPETNAALVYFEHFIDRGSDKRIAYAITNYELHLRYYVLALRQSSFPFAYHTIGSCMTVTSEAYQKQGGMNQRKAGEDFYFLQKIFPLGNIKNIVTTKVMPSPRISDRVPFGTGKAVSDILKSESQEYSTYNPKSFIDFQKFNLEIQGLWIERDLTGVINKMPVSVQQYLKSIDFIGQIKKIKSNSKNESAFNKSFYAWFNGFKALKYIHFSRDNFYEKIEILEAVNWLIEKRCGVTAKSKTEALKIMRGMDRSDQ